MKILILIFFFLGIKSYSQTSEQFFTISTGIDKTYPDFEKLINTTTEAIDTKFGLESRAYDFDTFSIIAEEKEDKDHIDELTFLSHDKRDNSESWYNLCKTMNEDASFQFVESYLGNKFGEVKIKNASFSEIVKRLRETEDLTGYLVIVCFKKNNLYYLMNLIDTITMYKITKTYKPSNDNKKK